MKQPGIKKFKLKEIKPAQYNPRMISDDALEGLTNSIRRFGCVEPIVVNTRGGKNTIIGGHQRLKALQKLGVKSAVCVTVSCSKAEEKLLNLALNNPEIQGEFIEKIEEYITALKEEVGDDQAFLDLRINELIGEIEVETEGLTDDDAVPEVPEKPRTKKGDLYILGEHRLLCGDSTKSEDVERLMDGQKADMVFTDPPYNVNYGESKNPRHKIRKIEGDNKNVHDFKTFIIDMASAIKSICQGDIYLWTASSPEGMSMMLAMISCGMHWSATIICEKDRLILTPANYQRIYESCLYGWFGKSTYNGNRRNIELWECKPKIETKDIVPVELCCREEFFCPFSHIDIWKYKRPSDSKLHPTMKPVEIILRALKNSSKKKNICFDGFLGSGSTLIACEKLGRRCYGMEIDEHYCDVIVRRWEEFTGKKARLQADSSKKRLKAAKGGITGRKSGNNRPRAIVGRNSGHIKGV